MFGRNIFVDKSLLFVPKLSVNCTIQFFSSSEDIWSITNHRSTISKRYCIRPEESFAKIQLCIWAKWMEKYHSGLEINRVQVTPFFYFTQSKGEIFMSCNMYWRHLSITHVNCEEGSMFLKKLMIPNYNILKLRQISYCWLFQRNWKSKMIKFEEISEIHDPNFHRTEKKYLFVLMLTQNVNFRSYEIFDSFFVFVFYSIIRPIFFPFLFFAW